MLRCFIETQKKAVSGIRWFLRLGQQYKPKDRSWGWVGFVSKELHSFVKSKSNPTISPDLNLSTCYWAFVWFICGIIWTPPHMLCHVWWFIKRGLCPQHQLGSKKSSNHGGHGQKAPAHLGDRPTELICITNINTRDDLLSPEYQAVSPVFLNVISHRGKNDEHSSNLLFPLECTREHKW